MRKPILKILAACFMVVLLGLNLNVYNFSDLNFGGINFTVETQTANAQADPSTLHMAPYICPTSNDHTYRCFTGGNGCDVGAQTVCDDDNKN